MTLIKIMFPDELQLHVDRVELEDGRMVMSVTAISEESICPHCGTASERIHSSYQRHPADLSVAGYTVCLDITVPRFFCDNEQCQANTFAERMTCLIKPYAHRTDRLADQQRRVAFEAGGEAGARLLNELGMPTSPDTLIRLVRNASEPEMNTPRVLGIDDWAKRKGQSYGTILVDLEAHRPVDLLPDRSAELVAEWLRAHPGVEIISRDRGVEYIKGATDGAPDAIQVADRWHLLTNIRDALKRLLESKRACLRAAADKSGQDDSEHEQLVKSTESEETSTARTSEALTKLTKAEKQKLAGRVKRQERYEAVK
jgi:transposase